MPIDSLSITKAHGTHKLRTWPVHRLAFDAGARAPAWAHDSGPSPRSVAVLGAGIVGLASAWELVQQGYDVTVVDRATSGAGTSRANGAQLSYSCMRSRWPTLPSGVSSPSCCWRAIRRSLRIQADLAQWAWGLQFLAACRDDVSRRTTEALLALAAHSRTGFDAMMAQTGLDCDFSATGKLVLYADAAAFAGAQRQMLLQRALGSVQHAVTAAQCLAIEPALEAQAPRIAGPSTPPANARRLLQGMRRAGSLLRAGRAVHSGHRNHRPGHRRRPSARRAKYRWRHRSRCLRAGNGHGSVPLARGLGSPAARLSAQGLQRHGRRSNGTHLGAAGQRDRRGTQDRFARLGDRLRIAGMAELVGNDASIKDARIATLLAAGRDVFPRASDYIRCRPVGWIAASHPTGLPIVGTLPNAPANLLFNTGHGALGFTLAFGTAQALLAPCVRPVVPDRWLPRPPKWPEPQAYAPALAHAVGKGANQLRMRPRRRPQSVHKSVHCGLKRQDLHTVVIGRLGGTGFHNRHPTRGGPRPGQHGRSAPP